MVTGGKIRSFFRPFRAPEFGGCGIRGLYPRLPSVVPLGLALGYRGGRISSNDPLGLEARGALLVAGDFFGSLGVLKFANFFRPSKAPEFGGCGIRGLHPRLPSVVPLGLALGYRGGRISSNVPLGLEARGALLVAGDFFGSLGVLNFANFFRPSRAPEFGGCGNRGLHPRLPSVVPLGLALGYRGGRISSNVPLGPLGYRGRMRCARLDDILTHK